jgi:hypothetical protein
MLVISEEGRGRILNEMSDVLVAPRLSHIDKLLQCPLQFSPSFHLVLPLQPLGELRTTSEQQIRTQVIAAIPTQPAISARRANLESNEVTGFPVFVATGADAEDFAAGFMAEDHGTLGNNRAITEVSVVVLITAAESSR